MTRLRYAGTPDTLVVAKMVEHRLAPGPLTDIEVAQGYQHDADDVSAAEDHFLVPMVRPTWFQKCPCGFCIGQRRTLTGGR